MRALWMCILLLAAMVAGCAEDPATDVPTPDPRPTVDVPTGAGLVHTKDGLVKQVTDPLLVAVGTGISTGFNSFEPTIGVTSDGYLFMSNSQGAIATGHSSIVRSTDGGATWHDITPKLGPISTPPTTFDPYIHVDQDTDRIYNLDMEGLNCNYIQWSDDGGESFVGHPLGCGQPPVLDHPSLFTGTPRLAETIGYPNIVYLCVNRVADSACAVSLDGGIVFTPFRPVFPQVPPNEGQVPQSCGGLAAHGTTGPDGRAYLGKNHCGAPMVAMTDDDGLTWQVHEIPAETGIGGHDVEVAVDEAGNVYALWRDTEWDLRFAVSHDHGASWSKPAMVSAPGVNMSVFPAIAAGAEGRVAFTYYGLPVQLPQSDLNDTHLWTAYLTTVLNATSEPVFISTTISDHPIARGACDDDNRCSGVGDFVDIVIDQDGRPWAGIFDSCGGNIPDQCDGPGTGFLGTLRQGPALRGELAPLPVLPAF